MVGRYSALMLQQHALTMNLAIATNNIIIYDMFDNCR